MVQAAGDDVNEDKASHHTVNTAANVERTGDHRAPLRQEQGGAGVRGPGHLLGQLHGHQGELLPGGEAGANYNAM